MDYDHHTKKSSKPSEPLGKSTAALSKTLLKQLADIGKPFTLDVLKKFGAKQAIFKDIPVLAFPMHTGSLHCVNYSTYPAEPRFLNAAPATEKKGTAVQLGLLGTLALPKLYTTIILTEGIWDALTLVSQGYTAVGLPGVNNWHDSWSTYFKDKNVIILFDNDDPGCKFALRHAKRLLKVAKSLKIVTLPKTVQGVTIKDVSDLFALPGFNALTYLNSLIKETEEFTHDIRAQIHDAINLRGSTSDKIELITALIVADIMDGDGAVVPFNDKQEFAFIIGGKDVLTDRSIDIFMAQHYNYIPSMQLWRAIKENLYNHAVRNHASVQVQFYSTCRDDTLYLGSKGEGIYRMDQRGTALVPQGTDGVYIKTGNRINTAPATKKKLVAHSLEDLLGIFHYDEEILSKAEQVMLIRTWFYNSFFNFDSMQPILCAVGDTQSGKSQLFKFIKGTLFGFTERNAYNLNVIPEDNHEWSLLIKGKKYLFLDEVNESSPIIKKRLRTMATGIEESFRPKYGRHVISFVPEAWLAINGLNLVSSREHDIAKRLCLIKLERIDTQELTAMFGPEHTMWRKLAEARPTFWNSIINNLHEILVNLHKNKTSHIKLEHSCRFMGLANFAWQAWPEERDTVYGLFNKMDQLQSKHSADFDPLLDVVREWMDSHAARHANGAGTTKPMSTRILHKEMLAISRDLGVKFFPRSEAALGKWFSKREMILNEEHGYIRDRNKSSKNWEHIFTLDPNAKESF